MLVIIGCPFLIQRQFSINRLFTVLVSQALESMSHQRSRELFYGERRFSSPRRISLSVPVASWLPCPYRVAVDVSVADDLLLCMHPESVKAIAMSAKTPERHFNNFILPSLGYGL